MNNKRTSMGMFKQSTINTELSLAVRRVLGVGNTALILLCSPVVFSQSAFGPVVQLSELDGNDGFVINGIDPIDSSGESVSDAGDINGDGVDDLIIGALFADESYVLFGGASVGGVGTKNLAALDGSDGFVINGIDRLEFLGASVSGAGDINGDGLDDLIVGANRADGNGEFYAGESYVVFGGNSVGSSGVIELSDLDGSDGFVIFGINQYDLSGSSVSGAGDINGDGLDDLIISAPDADPNGISSAGEIYVVFGDTGVGEIGFKDLAFLDGSDGFVINGINANDGAGNEVSGAGDINGDGVGDLIIGAFRGDPNGNTNAGESYIIFGSAGVGSSGTVDLSNINGNDGVVVNGIDAYDGSGRSVSEAGDINGDGIDDLIIGGFTFGVYGEFYAGQSYVIFGNALIDNNNTIELSDLDGSDGFQINGGAYDNAGESVSGIGDFNGDGYDDLMIGASFADPNGRFSAGESYVVFGSKSVGSSGALNLLDLDGSNGFVVNGVDTSDYSGESVSGAGDINNDGLDDLIIGASSADPNGNDSAGESYVVFGRASCNGLEVTVNLNFGQTPGSSDDVVLGTPGNDDIRGRAGNDTICGSGGDDFIHGNSGDDWIDGGDGIDNIRGGQGADTIFSGSGATVGTASRVFGGNGDDIIIGGPNADDLRGGRGEDMISGEQGADAITGNEDNDFILGGSGADTLKGGGGGNDQLFGEGGADSLNGGSGNNDFCDGGGQNGDVNSNCESF